jgi:hypothetical protein
MALTVALAFASPNHVRYLVTSDGVAGGTATIANATLQADFVQGPLRQVARAKDDGVGTIPAGTVLTQAQSRALFLSDAQAADVGNNLCPRTICHVTKRSVAACDISCDANVDGAGKPTLEVQLSAINSIAYLDIIAQGAIGAQ